MSNPWFRMYAEFINDPKVQMLSEVDQRRYIMLLCARCNGDETLHETEAAFLLRISDEEYLATKARLMAKNLIDDDNRPVAWDKRQYASDSSTARVAAHRERMKRACNVTVTPPDTDTDTDTGTESIPPLSPPPVGEGSTKTAHGSRLPTEWKLPDDWLTWALTLIPDHRRVIRISESFRDHWIGAAGAKGRKADWQATWRNWIRREAERHENTGNRTPERESVVDRVARKNGFVRTYDGEFVRPEEVRDRATILDAHDGTLRLNLV